MDDRWLDSYLHELDRELRNRGIFQKRIREEVRSHLLDSAEHERYNGASGEEAQRRALMRFGPASLVAAQFYDQRRHTLQKILAAVAVVCGMLIAYVDSRPAWDDTGITVFALLTVSGLIGLLASKRPWLWALLVGIWLPGYYVVTTHNLTMLIILIFPFIGAFAGWLVRNQVINKLISA